MTAVVAPSRTLMTMPQPQRNPHGNSGLTTLEWLLVVAAVAGLAAVAVVLVQRVVGDTAEQIESHSARQEAAELATLELTQRWLAKTPDSQPDADDINRDYSQKCRTLGIIYGDIDLNPQPAPGIFQPPTGWMPPLDKPSCNLV